MPYRRKDSPVWWVSYRLPNGKRIRCSTGTTDRREADALEAKWKLEAYRARHWDERPETTFETLMLRYLTDTASKRSAATDRYRARSLRRHFAGRIMDRLDPPAIRAYVQARRGEGVADATINRELALLSSAIGHVNRELELTLPNPVKGRLLKEPEGRTRWITREEAERLIEAAGQARRVPFLADFITVALYTGCRKEELMGLEWARVDLSANLLRLDAEHTKAGKRRSVPLCDTARAALIRRAAFRAAHCPDAPWVFVYSDGHRTRDIRHAFRVACEQAGISDFRIHDLRHTCAAWLVTAGAPLAEIRDILGHSTVMMTERYAHLSPENLRTALARLDGAGHDSVTLNRPFIQKSS